MTLPKKKTNEEFIYELESKYGGEYTPLEEYKGNNTKIKFLHQDCNCVIEVRPKDILLGKSKCSICSGNKKLSYDEMKNFIENNSNCILLSTEIKNSQSNIDLECECGNKFTTRFYLFKHENKRRCNECSLEIRKEKQRLSYEYVNNFIESKGYILLDKDYNGNSQLLNIKCKKGHIFTKRFYDFDVNIPCPKCSLKEKGKSLRLEFELVKKNIEFYGYKLLDDNYINSKTKLNIQCPAGHDFKMAYSDFHYNGQRCPQCYIKNKKENATSHIFLWLRTQIVEWKKETMKKDNYKCVITNKPMEVIHHLYSFNLIAKETLETLDIPILEHLSDYTNDQIELMKNKCIELHNVYGLGVCLTKEVHNLFHEIYGRKINTPEQFEEFKIKYINGKLENLMVS